jgi:hypothetical protein
MLAADISPEIMVTIEDRNGSKEIHLFDESGNPVSE